MKSVYIRLGTATTTHKCLASFDVGRVTWFNSGENYVRKNFYFSPAEIDSHISEEE